MISIDNSFFFNSKGMSLNSNNNYKKNLSLAKKVSDELYVDFDEKKNETLSSFTSDYQKKIRNIKKNLNINQKKKIVIGLGGSSSGAKALSFFLKDDLIFFDNLDYEYFYNFFRKNKAEDYFYFIISKSGDTFETLALLNLLIKESKNYKNFDLFKSMVVITENKESILNSFVEKNNIQFLEHNPNIGGRFSILSETGMLPFVDQEIIVEDASERFLNLLKDQDNDLSPVKNAAIIFTCQQEMNLAIYCNLLYNYRLKHFSYWLHQLHAESLGKNGLGMTPTTSICPKDHHSMMQLYLDGPRDKFFNIFNPPNQSFYDNFNNEDFYNIETYSPSGLLKQQHKAVVEVFYEKKIPHRLINLDDSNNSLNLIELFSYFLLETIILGKMMGIDPFNQPSVQLVKEKIFKN